MNLHGHFFSAFLCVSMFGFGLVPSAFAQEKEAEQEAQADVAVNTRFGDWVVHCEAVTVTRNVCRLVQEQVLRTNNALVLRMIGLPAADGGAVLLAQVPLGIHLPSGAVYRAEASDEAEQTEMVWQSCYANVCEAAIVLDAGALTAFEQAETVLFGYRPSPEVDPLITRVQTAGMVAGLNSLRKQEE